MSAAQDRAEAAIREVVTVKGVCLLPKWPGHARRVAAALEGVDRLTWNALRDAICGADRGGMYRANTLVEYLVTLGVIVPVVWDVESGVEVEGPHARMFMAGVIATCEESAQWREWAHRVVLGYRLARPTAT